MGLQLVKSEFAIKSKRIDSLAFDRQTNEFIIIEYKKDKNYSVVDQGLTYLNLMLQNKAELILTYNETLKDIIHSKDVA
jgi:RecB family endonuclease NucS